MKTNLSEVHFDTAYTCLKISVREPSDKMFDDFGSDICIVMSDDFEFSLTWSSIFIHYSDSPFNTRASSPGLGYILIYVGQSYS